MRFPMYSYGLWKAGGREGGKSVRPRKKPLATRLSQRESGRSARRIYVIFTIVSHFLHFCQVKAPPGRKNPPVGAKSFYCLLIAGAAASSAVVAFCRGERGFSERRSGLPSDDVGDGFLSPVVQGVQVEFAVDVEIFGVVEGGEFGDGDFVGGHRLYFGV